MEQLPEPAAGPVAEPGSIFVSEFFFQGIWTCWPVARVTVVNPLPHLLPFSFRQSTWPATTGVAAITPLSATTRAYRTWSSTGSTWNSLKACSACCSPGPMETTPTRWPLVSSASLTRTEMLSSTSGTSSMAWVSGGELWRYCFQGWTVWLAANSLLCL